MHRIWIYVQSPDNVPYNKDLGYLVIAVDNQGTFLHAIVFYRIKTL